MDNKDTYDLSKVFQRCIKYNQLVSYFAKERFYEIGSYKGIEDFKKYVEENLK